MILRAPYLLTALKLQEAASELANSDVRARLRDAISDKYRGTDKWGYYMDHFGDGESGDVIFSCSGDTFRAPYEISSDGASAAKCFVDFDSAKDVVPRTVYEEEADEADHYAAMEESLKKDELYSALPLYERFISKSERDSASSDDFAGKGKSFPILKPEDVAAAAHALGRAGAKNLSTGAIKSRIIAIAKRKGWTKYLPKAWQGGDSTGKESAARQSSDLRLVESAATVEAIVLKEAKADYEIKLIAPGKGSSAFYPKEVLRRDGPKVFKSGTHVYLNHPTAAEEAARPEGDVANLAGVLSSDAVYHESHAKGPGLYARMKVFADHAQTVEEKAPYVGMSIRAGGIAESNKKQDGLPILKELTHAESVDVVTRAGAGGMILTEAARPATTPTNQQEVSDMDAAEIKKLVEAGIAQATAPLRERALRGDAQILAAKTLKESALPQASKERVIDSVLRNPIPTTEAGELDAAKFTEAVNAAAKDEAAYVASLTGAGRVVGMGAAAPVQIDAKEAERREAEQKRFHESAESIFTSLCGGNKDAGKAAAFKGVN